MPVLVPAQYAPDQPAFPSGASASVRNCLPRTAQSYGPMPGLAVAGVSGPLDDRAQGAIGVLDRAGNAYAFAGDAAKLYSGVAGAATWTDASKSGGYSTGAQERWSFAYYGADRVVGTNFADAIQSYVVGASTAFADLSADAPKARHVGQILGFLFALNTFDSTDGNRPGRSWWSAQDDPTSWPAPGSDAAAAAQSDFQDHQGELGAGQGVVGGLGSAHGALFFERGIVRVQYVGGATVFDFDVAEGVRGTPAPGSIAQIGGTVYYLGEDGFYAFDGANSVPIGAELVDKRFFADLDQSKFDRISSAVDPINKVVFWAYPSAGASGGNPNRLLAYNWFDKRWSLIDGLADVELIFRSLSFGYTLDGLDTVSSSLDALPFSLDSRAWTGGRLLLSAFDASHRLNYFTGATLAATIDSEELQPFPGQRAHVNYLRPLCDAACSVAVGVRERQADAVTWGAAMALDATGACQQRTGGRYLRARTTIAAGAEWAHFAGLDAPTPDENPDDPAVVPDGGR